MKKIGFTLAETLITLGIIGVVAAMTLPGIINNTSERQTVIKLKRTYSILQNVVLKMRAQNGDLNEWVDDSTEYLLQELSKNLAVIKKCNSAADCSVGFAMTYPAITLNDGTAIAVASRNPNNGTGHVCSAQVSTRSRIELHYNSCATVLIDINGKGKPNEYGKDIFEFRFFTNRVLPNGINNKESLPNVEAENFDTCLNNKGNSGTCTAWVIINENLDYLHCPEKIGWNKAKSCKDK